MEALLGIDLGTTGVKAALFAAEDGRVLAHAFVDYPLYHPHPGWAEQNPADWWQATVSAIRTCLASASQAGARPSDVKGVGISGQMHGVVLLDQAHQVLRPCIIWADQRSDLVLADVEADVAHGGLLAVSDPEVLELEDRLALGLRPVGLGAILERVCAGHVDANLRVVLGHWIGQL